MSFTEKYKSKVVGAQDAVRMVKDNDTIVASTGAGETPALLTALSELRREFNGVAISRILAFRQYDYLNAETSDHVQEHSYFVGGTNRKLIRDGYGDVIPNFFHDIPHLIREERVDCDVVFALASPMDAHGYFSISIAPDYTMAAIERARVVILEVNPKVPYAYGNCHVHVDQVHAIVEDETDLITVGLPKIGEIEQTIGGLVAELVPNEATLQIGYGAIPDAVVMQLDDKHDLGIHTEMVGDGILSLVKKGIVTNKKKNFMPGKMAATFALGTQELYDFIDRNPMVEMHPVDFTNDPYIAAQNDNMITINGTIEIDFMGQCNSESIGGLAYSGTGGQLDFVRAANRSKGGKNFIVLPSTAKGGTISKIVPRLSPGAHVTTGKNEVAYVATEYGCVNLRGMSVKERAKALIGIAHPDFRDELREEAAKLKLIKTS